MCSKRLPNRLIKKSFRAYNTAGQFVLFILFDREAIRLALFKPGKHIVHRVHKILVILLDLHAGNHIHKGIHVPILGRPLENDVGDQSTVQKRFRFRPEWISFLAFALGVGNQGIHEFQNIGLVADVG